jgi:uncharacterized membrane protein (UPF0127 family)
MNRLITIFLLIILGGIITYFGYIFIYKINISDNQIKVVINQKEYILSIAKTDEERSRGLAKFDTIKENEGMLFIFDVPGRYSFYMKDMKFNIDIIFLDQNKIVVDLYKNVKFQDYKNPYDYEAYKPNFNSKYTIELKEGEVEKNGIKIGDYIDFSIK